MKAASRTHALLVCGLALFFSYIFFLLKHAPAFRDIVPFGDDPYDAVGSLAVIVANLLAATSLVRAFLPRFAARNSNRLYASRTQAAVALCILITVLADAVALLRHPSQWTGAPGKPALLTALLCLAAASIAVLLVVCRPFRSSNALHWIAAFAVLLGTILCLWLYPESLIDKILTHLLTIDIGDLLLFAPVTFFVLALLPGEPPSAAFVRASRSRTPIPRWPFIALVGLAVGLCIFVAEIRHSSGSIPFARLALVASVYAYAGLSGLLIAYAFLRRPLGFVSAD